MKRFTFIAAAFIFTAVFAVSAFAQGAAPTTTGKIGLVNTYAFGEEKAGITKFKNAMKVLETEFKPANDKLRGLATRFDTLRTEIDTISKNANNSAVPINTSQLQAKGEELQNLEVQIKREQEDAKRKYASRYQIVVGPVNTDIVKALNDFAKQKGYAVILDGAKLEESGLLMGFDDKYDVTKDFIVFYNARPAGTATTAAPK